MTAFNCLGCLGASFGFAQDRRRPYVDVPVRTKFVMSEPLFFPFPINEQRNHYPLSPITFLYVVNAISGK